MLPPPPPRSPVLLRLPRPSACVRFCPLLGTFSAPGLRGWAVPWVRPFWSHLGVSGRGWNGQGQCSLSRSQACSPTINTWALTPTTAGDIVYVWRRHSGFAIELVFQIFPMPSISLSPQPSGLRGWSGSLQREAVERIFS